MSESDKINNIENHNNGSRIDDSTEEKSFIRETIKKKPLNKRSLITRIVLLCAGAIAFGVIAAFVYVNVLPFAEKISGKEEAVPRVTIVPDSQDITDTPAAASSSETAASSSSTSETPETTPEPAETPPAVIVENKEFTLEDYAALNESMTDIALDASVSVVSVTGITSQMDYFNRSYEHKQQISGLIVADTDTDYYVLTEDRIFANVERIQVTFNDGYTADAIYQRSDPQTGLVILKIDKSQIPAETKSYIVPAEMGSSYSVRQGDIIIALGSPMGYSGSVAFGNITSVGNVVSVFDNEYRLLMTDIIGSSSGSGVLINSSGLVVGIIAQSYAESNGNVVTALAISRIYSLIETLINNDSKAYIGIMGQEVTSQISDKTGIPKGVIITEISDDSPAMHAGLTLYDVVIQIGEDKVTNMQQYASVLADLEPDQNITILAYRKGAEGYSEIEFSVTTGEI